MSDAHEQPSGPRPWPGQEFEDPHYHDDEEAGAAPPADDEHPGRHRPRPRKPPRKLPRKRRYPDD